MTDYTDSAPAPLTSPSQPPALPTHDREPAAADSNVAAQGRTPLDLDAVFDFPSAWKTMADTEPQQHHEHCSYRTQNRALLCDCAAIKASSTAWLIGRAPLLREVSALRAELDAAEAKELELQVELSGWDEENTRLRAELDAARAATKSATDEVLRLDDDLKAARAKRTPTEAEFQAAMDGAREQFHAVGLGAEFDAAHARAERTEPATGEDVEVVARAMYLAWHHGGDSDGGRPWEDQTWDVHREYRRAAPHVLAALDLPGRVEALREENERLRNNRILSVIFGVPKDAPRPFALYRRSDVTGVSGTGVVAEGVAFSDGTACLRWTSEWPTSVVFHDRGVEAIEQIHGHGGATQIVWLSEDLGTLAEMEQDRDEALKELAAEVELADANAAHIEHLTAERDAANAALADVARLLDEAREETAELHRRIKYVADAANRVPDLGDGMGRAIAVGLTTAAKILAHGPDYAEARQHAGGEGGAVSAWDQAEARFNAATEGGAGDG